MANKNMFGKAKVKKVVAKKTDDKVIVNVAGTEFASHLEKFAKLKAQMDDLKAEMAMSQEFVKGVGIDEYANLVEGSKSNPGSFILASETGGRVMILPTKKYIKIDEAQAEALQESYGEDIVTEKTDYGFNTDILMRNMDTISEILMNSDKISEDDKENLIEAKITIAVEKEALDKVYSLSKESGNDVAEVIEDLQPVVMMKNAKC